MSCMVCLCSALDQQFLKQSFLVAFQTQTIYTILFIYWYYLSCLVSAVLIAIFHNITDVLQVIMHFLFITLGK